MTVTDARAQQHATATTTEAAAARRAARFAGTLRGRLLLLVADAGDAGLTATEAFEIYSGIYGEPRGGQYSISPRLSELEREGFATKGEYVRERRHSYVATDAGLAWARSAA